MPAADPSTQSGQGQPVISVVSPVYRGVGNVAELVRQLHEVLGALTPAYEIILVDDRSPDESWSKIKQCSQENQQVKGIRLSKNSGQQKAIIAGMEAAQGDFLVVMDCDLQEETACIKQLYEKIQEGYDMVLTKRKSRQFSLFRNGMTWIYYKLLTFFTNSTFSFYQTGLLSMISRKVADAMLLVNHQNWYYLPVLSQLGFHKTFIEVTHQKRFAGKSAYSFGKLYNHGVNLVLGYSVKLLHISIGVGLLFVLGALIWAAVLIVIFIKGSPPPGYTSIMVGLLLCTGFILLSIGITGLYIGKIFEQAKNDPVYFIDETVNL